MLRGAHVISERRLTHLVIASDLSLALAVPSRGTLKRMGTAKVVQVLTSSVPVLRMGSYFVCSSTSLKIQDVLATLRHH
jgi:hypothetical protein